MFADGSLGVGGCCSARTSPPPLAPSPLRHFHPVLRVSPWILGTKMRTMIIPVPGVRHQKYERMLLPLRQVRKPKQVIPDHCGVHGGT